MTDTRTTTAHGRRASYTPPARLNLRLLPPLTLAAMRKASNLGTLTIVSARTLVACCLASSLGTAAFALGVLILTRR